MFSEKYGPFAGTMAIAAALLTVFSAFLMKAVGRVSQWTFLADDSPPFMVTAGTRAIAIALIGLTFIFIDKNNYSWFGGAAAIFAALMIAFIARFDRLRKAHICKEPLLNENGSQQTGWFGSPKWRMIVIGSHNDMTPQAAAAYRKFRGGLCQFLSGYGQQKVNNPEAIWTRETLAGISSKMTVLLIGILLCGVMALYLTASAIEVHQRSAPTSAMQKRL